MDISQKEEKFTGLPDRKIQVTPIIRDGAWVDKTKANSFLFGDSVKSYCAKQDKYGNIMCPLTKSEREFFEDLLGLDLNPRLKTDNFWSSIKNNVTLRGEITTLDLSNPEDYIRYKILLQQKDAIAPSGKQKYDKGTYKFSLEEIGFDEKRKSKAFKIRKEGFRIVDKLDSKGLEAKKDFLSVVFDLAKVNRSVPLGASSDWIDGELDKMLQTNVSSIIEAENHPSFNEIVLLKKAFKARAITKEGSALLTKDGELMGKSRNEAIIWLKDPENQTKVLIIESIVKEAKGL